MHTQQMQQQFLHTKKDIPAFHYMVAMAGGSLTLSVQNMQPYGTRTLSKNIILALRNRRACLISNHGQIAFEKNISQSF